MTKKGGMYKAAHKTVCKIIHVHATLSFPCGNNKYKCGIFLSPKISEHCYTDLWIHGSIRVISALQTGKTESTGLSVFRWLHKCLCLVLVV